MDTYIRYEFKWKPVKGNFTQEKKKCPRCHNEVKYFLAWDGEGLGFGAWTLIHTKKAYAYKCPICPNYEPLMNEVVKAIMKA